MWRKKITREGTWARDPSSGNEEPTGSEIYYHYHYHYHSQSLPSPLDTAKAKAKAKAVNVLTKHRCAFPEWFLRCERGRFNWGQWSTRGRLGLCFLGGKTKRARGVIDLTFWLGGTMTSGVGAPFFMGFRFRELPPPCFRADVVCSDFFFLTKRHINVFSKREGPLIYNQICDLYHLPNSYNTQNSMNCYLYCIYCLLNVKNDYYSFYYNLL